MEAGAENIDSQPFSPAASGRWSLVFLIVKGIVGVTLLYIVFSMIDIPELLKSFESAKLFYVMGAVLLLICNLGSRIVKWKFMLRATGNDASTWDSVASVLLGISLGSFTPAQLGELGGRFMRVTNGKSAHIIGLTLLDRSQIFLVLAMSGLTSYAFLIFPSAHEAVPLSVLVILGSLFLYYHLDLINKLAARIRPPFLRHQWLKDFFESFSLMNSRQITVSLLISIIFNAVLYAQMFLLLNAFGTVDAWSAFLGFSAMMFFKSLLPISIGDLGVREASTVYFFSLLGVSTVVALNAALMMFAVNMILPSLLGVFFLPGARTYRKTVAS